MRKHRRVATGCRRAVVTVALCGGALLAWSAPADAARPASGAERLSMLRAAAASEGGAMVRLRVGSGGRATMEPLGSRGPATILAVRSSLDRSWALLIASLNGRADVRRTFLLERRHGSWRVRMSAGRGDEGDGLCRLRRPGIAVALDLGLSTDTWSKTCRHKRERKRLVRRMSAAELASVRAMVEWKYDQSTFELRPGPVQPAVHEVFASDCAWDGRGSVVPRPVGEVARSDPRWGIVRISCVIGSDGFGALESATVMLVARAGDSGPFTRVPAHTHPAWSVRGGLCRADRRWPVPASARVALEFCTPFPAALRPALR
ncbi:MAG TPA: hypothetical protein VHF88_00875 [Thermoleophilaceae bacterium]|nr:hypothetical protein [Thermoleophilaceae bacterium]